LAKRVADVLSQEINADPRNISVSPVQVELDAFFSTGELAPDRRRREGTA